MDSVATSDKLHIVSYFIKIAFNIKHVCDLSAKPKWSDEYLL